MRKTETPTRARSTKPVPPPAKPARAKTAPLPPAAKPARMKTAPVPPPAKPARMKTAPVPSPAKPARKKIAVQAPPPEVEVEAPEAAPVDPADYPAKVKFILDVLDDMKALDVETYHVVGKTIVTDYFIICTGSSRTHTGALADALRVKCKEQGWRLGQMEGHDNPSWKILDYADVVVHVFLQETREYYRLEEIWGEGRHVIGADSLEPVIEPILPIRPKRGTGATAALRKRRAAQK